MLCAQCQGRQFRQGRSMHERYLLRGKEHYQAEGALGSAVVQRRPMETPMAIARHHDIKHFMHGTHVDLTFPHDGWLIPFLMKRIPIEVKTPWQVRELERDLAGAG